MQESSHLRARLLRRALRTLPNALRLLPSAWRPAAALAAVTLALGLGALPARAEEPFAPYAERSDILATVPSADEGALGAIFNPAQWGMMEHGELDVWWSDRGVRRNALDNWGLAFGKTLGFSARRHDFILGGAPASVTDFQLGLGGGTRAHATGIAYGWSAGDDEAAGREDFLALGSIFRPAPWLSVGTTGRLALGRPGSEGVLDLAVRPLSDPRVLLFADYALARRQTLEEGALAGGIALRPVEGVQAALKVREGGSYQLSFGLTLGRLGAQALPAYDSDGELGATRYVARLNPQLRGVDLDGLRSRGRRFARMDLHGSLVYQKARYGDEGWIALRELTERLRFAREDRTVGGVALSLSGLRGNPAMLWEVRRSLEELRAAGKRVVVYADVMDLPLYYLATVADRLVMDPEGMLVAPGVQGSRTYLKHLLEKVGIGFDEWRFLEYKSAMESFSRDRMSEADREQRQALADDTYEELARGIAGSGRMTRASFDSTVNERPLLLARELAKRGWVDRLGRGEDLEEVCDQAAGRNVRLVSRSRLSALRDRPDEIWGERPAVALVYALGPCAMDVGIRARATSKALRDFRKNAGVKAVVLRADSPGGEIVPSDLVAGELRELKKAHKPAYVSQGRVAASGGYVISMEADSIAVSPFTITGSIGVIGGWFWNDGLGGKLGLTSDRVQVGRSADLMGGLTLPLVGVTIPERNLDERERALAREAILTAYDTFVRGVARARDLEESYVRQIAEGRVYSGRDGIEKRIVDRVATLEETIESARRAAGIAPGRKVRVIEYPRPPLFRLPSFVPPFVRGILGGGREAAEAAGPSAARLLPPTFEGRALEMLLQHPGRPLLLAPGSVLPDEEPVVK